MDTNDDRRVRETEACSLADTPVLLIHVNVRRHNCYYGGLSNPQGPFETGQNGAGHANETDQLFHRTSCAVSGQRTELMNRAILGIIADAWNRYPSEVPLPTICTDDQELLGQFLSLLADEGLFRLTGKAVALTMGGYVAVGQARRTDRRLADIIQGELLPAEVDSTSVVLAVVRANFELKYG